MQNKRHALMRRYEDAIRAHEMKGAQRPEIHDDIDAELGEARKAMREALSYMVKSKQATR